MPRLDTDLAALLASAGTSAKVAATLGEQDISSVSLLAKLTAADFASMGISIGSRIKLTTSLASHHQSVATPPPPPSGVPSGAKLPANDVLALASHHQSVATPPPPPSRVPSGAKLRANDVLACLASLPASSPLHRGSALSRLRYRGWAWPTLWLSPGANSRTRYLAIPKAGSTTVWLARVALAAPSPRVAQAGR